MTVRNRIESFCTHTLSSISHKKKKLLVFVTTVLSSPYLTMWYSHLLYTRNQHVCAYVTEQQKRAFACVSADNTCRRGTSYLLLFGWWNRRFLRDRKILFFIFIFTLFLIIKILCWIIKYTQNEVTFLLVNQTILHNSKRMIFTC